MRPKLGVALVLVMVSGAISDRSHNAWGDEEFARRAPIRHRDQAARSLMRPSLAVDGWGAANASHRAGRFALLERK